MKLSTLFSLGAFAFSIFSFETMAVECPLVAQAPEYIKCIGNSGNYNCTYNSKFWKGEFASPIDPTKQAANIKALGHAGQNSCRYSIETSSSQLVNYILDYKAP